MRSLLAAAFMAVLASVSQSFAQQSAPSACSMSVERVLQGSSHYFGGTMLRQDGATASEAVYRHQDDPRIIVRFAMQDAPPVDGLSRSQYVENLDRYGAFFVDNVKRQGRWAEKAVYPFDPVAWRTVEEVTIPDVGPSFAGRMEIRITPQCLLAADFVSPSSPNLLSRFKHLTTMLAGIRDTSMHLVVEDRWAPEDTTPVGVAALAGGLLSPLGVIGLLYLLMGHIRRFDPPGINTRIVLGSCSAIALGTLAYQSRSYLQGLDEMRYIDNAGLMALVVLGCIAGAALGQRSATFGLLCAVVAGITVSLASSMNWVPDQTVGFAVGGALILLGLLGFFAWHVASTAIPLPKKPARQSPQKA